MGADCDFDRSLASRTRRVGFVAAFALIAGLLVSAEALALPASQPHATSASSTAKTGVQEAGLSPENTSEVSDQSVHGESVWRTIARLFNFAILAGVLVYFLREPIGRYLARRSTEIRSDLVTAAETRQAAERELAAIELKVKALPAEIEALKARGAAEIAAEEARIHQAADAERARLLEQARREIDVQLRAAERELVKRAAELTVSLASDRIKRAITDEDQKRLVDQYLAQMNK